VCVPLVVAGINAVHIGRQLDLGIGQVFFGCGQFGVNRRESAVDLINGQVGDSKIQLRMWFIQVQSWAKEARLTNRMAAVMMTILFMLFVFFLLLEWSNISV